MSNPYVGEIRMGGWNFAPSGWAFCDGSLLPISQYETLFNLIGTYYGGDGQTTFALPDLRGRVVMHQGSDTQQNFVLGQVLGTESVTLVSNQLPSHAHAVIGSSGGGASSSPSGNAWATWTGAPYVSASENGGAQMSSLAIGPAGGGQPHDNMMPYQVITFVISLFGIYPSQN
jgi:microcystin-dependent protein